MNSLAVAERVKNAVTDLASQNITLTQIVKHRPSDATRLIKDLAVPSLVGLFTGFLAGLVGLGGAELRIPFILYLLGVPIREMIPLNLIISLITSGSSFLVRWQAGLLPLSALPLSFSMILGSLGGGFLGPMLSHRVSVRKLKAFLALILSFVIVKLVAELFVEAEPASIFPVMLELIFGVIFGFGIGLIAGGVGVAGGEYRIPTLVFLFGFPIKIAGTISQLVSIPTVIVGILKHNQYGTIGRRAIWIGAVMGGGSILGVILTGMVLVTIPNILIEVAFILVLSYTIIKLVEDLLYEDN